ncbi:MAG: hypothetical protein IT537_02155 [Hyphomicrobiales bacterium]|nr:hypothetical protein [Hyphomicrobiales bacterium]
MGELDGDVLGAMHEHQLAIMELHDLVAQLYARRLQPRELGVAMVDREADMG